MQLIIWSAVELAVTLICVGIPTVRPLYRVIVHGSHAESSDGRYIKHDDSNHSSSFRMGHLGKDTTCFNVVSKGHTESYITRGNPSDEEILVSQHRSNHDAIRIREDVMVESV